ncbi:MAG: indole-3-glycerol phosphate synthase TrpC [Cytophagales bacterium]
MATNILQQIVASKYQEVEMRKVLLPVAVLEKSDDFERKCFSLKDSLNNSDTGIIAEFKRKSPSKGIFDINFKVEEITTGYVANGATALSVLTDEDFFGGSLSDLVAARNLNDCPILRKDFMVDEYQVVAAKACGADVILLIAAAITPEQSLKLATFAKSLGLEVLLEVKNKEEIEPYLNPYIDCVGVNNRNLENFVVNVETSMELASFIPNEFVKISESGISNAETIKKLRNYGYRGFLIGEAFMQSPNPIESFQKLFSSLA